MNTENSKANESNKFIYQFTDKLDLKKPNNNMALAHLSIYYTGKNIKSQYSNNKFKISTPIWNVEFDLPDGSYPVSEYIIKRYEIIADNLLVQIYVNKKNRIVSKIKTGFKLELLSKETTQFLGSSKKILIKTKIKKLRQS